MLREEKQNMHSRLLVDTIFEPAKTEYEPPSAEVKKLLRYTIERELCIQKFTACAGIVNVNSAELVASNIDTLEKK